MLVLGSWATTNLALSPILASRTTGSEKYFHQMNGYFNAVNLVIAGFGYWKATKTDPAGLSLSQSLKEQRRIERILLLNTGLDVVYVGIGLYLIDTGKDASSNAQQLMGFGQSLALQGSFLFAFDLILYFLHRKNGTKMLRFIDNLSVHPTGFQLAWKF